MLLHDNNTLRKANRRDSLRDERHKPRISLVWGADTTLRTHNNCQGASSNKRDTVNRDTRQSPANRVVRIQAQRLQVILS